MSEVKTFSPTVVVDGQVVTPTGWMWVVALAMGGCEWAIEEADKPEFKAQIRAFLEDQKQIQIDAQIADLEQRLANLKAQRTQVH